MARKVLSGIFWLASLAIVLSSLWIGGSALLILKASANYVGSTSMEVGVRVEAEDLRAGGIRHTASAYLTFVALDETGKPRRMPPLILESDADRRRCAAAQKRGLERLGGRTPAQGP